MCTPALNQYVVITKENRRFKFRTDRHTALFNNTRTPFNQSLPFINAVN